MAGFDHKPIHQKKAVVYSLRGLVHSFPLGLRRMLHRVAARRVASSGAVSRET